MRVILLVAPFIRAEAEGGPAAARLCFSLCISSRTNNWQAAYGLAKKTHTLSHSHTCARPGVDMPESDRLHAQTHRLTTDGVFLF